MTPVVQQQSVNTEDARGGVTEPPIVTPTGSNLLFLQQPSNDRRSTRRSRRRCACARSTTRARRWRASTVTMSLNVPGVVLIGGVLPSPTQPASRPSARLQIGTPGTDYILTAIGRRHRAGLGAIEGVQRGWQQALNADLEVTQSLTQPILNTNTTITLTVTNNGPADGDGRRADRYAAGGGGVRHRDRRQLQSTTPISRTVTCPVGTLAPATLAQLRDRHPADGADHPHQHGVGGRVTARSRTPATTRVPRLVRVELRGVLVAHLPRPVCHAAQHHVHRVGGDCRLQ